MRRSLKLLWLCAVLGCGDDEPRSPQDRLQGVWTSESTLYECLLAVSFDGNYIEVREVCELESGVIAVVLHSGTFVATSDRITAEYEASSCANPDIDRAARYSFVGDDGLQIVFPDALILFERAPPPSGGSGSAVFGCFDDDGFFEPREVRAL